MSTFHLITVKPEFYQAITLMKNHMSLARKSKETINSYVGYISRFIRLGNRLPEDCTKHELIDFLLKQKEAYGLKYSTIKAYVCALRYYFTFIMENKEFSLKIPVPKIKDYDIEVLSVNEVKCLLDKCSNSKHRLMIQILYDTGIRVSELANLQLDHIDFNFKTISIINGKNNKTRTIHFGSELEKAILNYLNDFPTLFSKHRQHNRCHSLLCLKSNSIQRIISVISKRTNIKKKISAHIIRHTYAVHYLNFGGSIFRLQRILGHNKMRTTLHYLQYAMIPEGLDLSILDKLVAIKQEK